MENRANYMMVGFFTVMSLIMAAIFVVWIANFDFDKQYATYDVVFEGPVRGVELGGEVRFNGIKVGDVTDLGLNKGNSTEVIATIRVLSDTPVKQDSIAQLEPAGLTGLAYIQILAGSANSPKLVRQKGLARPTIYTKRGQIDSLFQGGQGLLDTSMQTMERLNRLFSNKNLENMTSTISNVEKATNLIVQKDQLLDNSSAAALAVKEAGVEVSRLAQSLSGASKAIGVYDELGQTLVKQTNEIGSRTVVILDQSQVVTENLQTLTKNANATITQSQNTLSEIEQTAQSLRTATSNINTAVTSVDTAAKTVDSFFTQGSYETLPDVSAAAQSMKNATDSVEKLVQETTNSPTGLLSKAPNPKVKWKK